MAKTVVITGASAGLGRITAHLFAARGERVGLIARSAEGLTQVQQDIHANGGMAEIFTGDLADPATAPAAAAHFARTLGPLDVWINNAMVTVFGPSWEISPEEYRRVTEVTYLGTVYGTLAAVAQLRERGGTIVQVGSALAYRAIPLQAPYCAAKHAVRGFTDALRTELLHENLPIALCSVHMPALNTPQFSWARSKLPRAPQPVPPIFQPDVGARALLAAVDHPRREIWVGAPTWQAIWGNRLAPSWLDRKLAHDGWAGQHQGAYASPRAGNLFEPVEHAHRGRGDFTAEARAKSWFEG